MAVLLVLGCVNFSTSAILSYDPVTRNTQSTSTVGSIGIRAEEERDMIVLGCIIDLEDDLNEIPISTVSSEYGLTNLCPWVKALSICLIEIILGFKNHFVYAGLEFKR